MVLLLEKVVMKKLIIIKRDNYLLIFLINIYFNVKFLKTMFLVRFYGEINNYFSQSSFYPKYGKSREQVVFFFFTKSTLQKSII